MTTMTAGDPGQPMISTDPVTGGAASPEHCLIDQVVAGNHEAFTLLLKPYERMIYASAFSILANEADAEEVAQEAVLKAFRSLARFRRESKFSTWLVQIVINEAKMKLRKDRRHLYESLDEGREGEDGDFIPRDFADWREIPSEALENQELREALAKALKTLDPKYRSVLVMRDMQHMNIRETAEALGISEANVKTRLSRARLQMREALAPGLTGGWAEQPARQPKSETTQGSAPTLIFAS